MPTREPVTGTARLIKLNGELYLVIVRPHRGRNLETVYRLTWLDPEPTIGYPAWRLTQGNGRSYDVILKPTGAECDCPDFHYCRNHIDAKGCKHVCSLRAVGLLTKETHEDDRCGSDQASETMQRCDGMGG